MRVLTLFAPSSVPTVSAAHTRPRWLIAAAVFAIGPAAIIAFAGGAGDEVSPGGPRPDHPVLIAPPTAVGAIERAVVNGQTLTIEGWALDLDRPYATQIRVSIDGEPIATATAAEPRFDIEAAYGRGARHGFDVTVDLGRNRPQSVCIYTAPDDDLVTCKRVAGEGWTGALLTDTNVLVEILGRTEGGTYRVATPCGHEATVSSGTHIRTTQILLDPGHGGSEVAAVGPNGLGEKSLNLAVARRTAKKLRERGFDVELTRTRDIRLPIATRANLANALEPDLFVSIHHNGGATGRQSSPGTQVYYQHDDDESRRLGGIVFEELFAAASEFPTAWVGNALDGVSTRLNAERLDFYGIHRRTPKVTSLITEFLWLSNGPEAALLAREDVQEAEAEALARGIERWFLTQHDGSGFIAPFVDTFDSGGGGFNGCVDPAL